MEKIYFSILFISAFLTIASVPFMRKAALRLKAVDVPGGRKIHQQAMPRTGGIAMALGAVLPLLLWKTQDRLFFAVLVGGAIIVGFGILDDIRNLGYRIKFLGQILAALVVILHGGVVIQEVGGLLPAGFFLPYLPAVGLTLFIMVGAINAINLSDGLDGLAGGISLLTFLGIWYLAAASGQVVIAVIALAMTGAIFGFLRYNTHPATIFMGDAGSQLIGFLAISLSLALTQRNQFFSPVLPLLLLGLPVLDTLTVMAERIIRGKSPFVADRNHIHHKLLRLGMFHTEAVFVLYVLQAGLITTACYFRFQSEWFLVVLYLLFAGLIGTGLLGMNFIGWKLQRPGRLDVLIKSRLRFLKQQGAIIKATFVFLKVGVAVLIISTSTVAGYIPSLIGVLAMAALALIGAVGLVKRQWLEFVLRLILFLFIPLMVYLAERDTAQWVTVNLGQLYHLLFGLLVIYMLLTLKYTQRRRGFKLTPLDFLILFVAVIAPNLPDQQLQQFQLGTISAKIIVLFFCYEVLMGELRGDLKWPLLTVVPSLGIIVIKAIY